MNEQTFVIIKPDAITDRLVGKILSRFEGMGLHIMRIEKRRKNDDWCRQHYAHIFQKIVIYERLRNFMIGGPIIGIILLGYDAVKRARKMVGATNPLEAEPGTVRGDWGKYPCPYNLVHASDSAEAVEREIELYFNVETDW